MEKPTASIIIPTYKRAYLIDYVLDALTNQTFKDFEVLVVLKPSGDGTEKIVNKYLQKLEIKLIPQTEGFVLDALNLGLQNANGKIIIFLDDDAIPFPNLVQHHVESYKLPNVGGVAGDVLTATLDDPDIRQFKNKPSDLIPAINRVSSASRIGFKVWNKPLKDQENHLFYISKAGIASMNNDTARVASRQVTKSLLGRGANMSVLSAAIENFRFPTSWILGFSWEQFLGWHIWKKGYNLFFNPELKVYHLEHGQSLSRGFKQTRRETLLYTEQKLLFFRLYGAEPDLSLMHRIVWLIVETAIDIKRICVNKELHRIARLKSTFYSKVIGFKWLVCKALGVEYSPLSELEKLQ
jgi:glycosyltransferase involved in cell wall biosynthesis